VKLFLLYNIRGLERGRATMPDPVFGIVGLVSASIGLAAKIYHYVESVRHAPQHARDLAGEVMAIGGVLELLRSHVQRENAQGNAFERTSVLFFAANGCNERLEEIQSRLSALTSRSRLLSRAFHRLKWPLDEGETRGAVEALHRYAQVFGFALNLDGL
jgi:hypothetical protein